MLHKKKTYIVGDHVLANKRRGTIKYIGESLSSKGILIGVVLESKENATKKRNRRKQLQSPQMTQHTTTTQQENTTYSKNSDNLDDKINKSQTTNGCIDNIVYIENKNKNMEIIFIEASKITKWLRGSDNTHLSRTFHMNQKVWIKSIKCKGIIKCMFSKPPQYIRNLMQKSQKIGKHYLGILLDKPLGNNINKIKYFQCKDKHDYFIKVDSKQIVPSSEYNERLSSDNLALIIDHLFSVCFHDTHLPQELIYLLISFFGAMDGTLNVKENQVYKYREHCLNLDDYYEYDSIYMGKHSRLLGGKLICIKCFGDMVMDEFAEISVSATVHLTAEAISEMNSNNRLQFGAKKVLNRAKGGGIIKIICFGNVFLRKNVLISANGEDPNGGGGTIYIKCETLLNHGRIFAVGCNNTEPLWDHGAQVYRWRYWQRGNTNGADGQIIIEGKYSEDGNARRDRFYCGPILMPPQRHLNHKSLSVRQ